MPRCRTGWSRKATIGIHFEKCTFLSKSAPDLRFTFRDSFLKSLKMLQYEIKQTQQDLAVDLKVETKPTKFADA